MDKKRSIKSPKKTLKRSSTPKKASCVLCKVKPNNAMVMAHSLYKKYSFTQNHFYLVKFNSIHDKMNQEDSTAES